MNNSSEVNRTLSPVEVDEIVWGLAKTLEEQRFAAEAIGRLSGRLGDIAAGDRAREAALDYSDWNEQSGSGAAELKRQALTDKAKALAARDNPLDRRDDQDDKSFKARLRSPRERFDDEEWPTSGEAVRAIGILSRNPRRRKKIRLVNFELPLPLDMIFPKNDATASKIAKKLLNSVSDREKI